MLMRSVDGSVNMNFFDWLCRPFASQAINPVMKDDHAQHFRELNALLTALDNLTENSDEGERQNNHVSAMLGNIVNEMSEHFRREQELMECYGYSGKDAHQTEHVIMIKNLERKYRETLSGARVVDKCLISTMKDWMTNHIRKHDLKLNEFLSTARPVGKLSKIVSFR